MTRALVTSSKYSPGNMTPGALEALFVGREKTLSDVLKRIAASATGEGKHFILLVGPRGVGKTHFVALAHHRLMTDPQYGAARRKLKVAYLNEEEWGVASFLDFLVRVLHALASSSGDTGLEARIEQVYQTHERAPALALSVAQSMLIEYVADSTLLLLCENLSDLFAGLGEEGQKRWRALIHEHPFWTILATTPALFADVELQTSPFYGFFTVRTLEKLDLETAVQLLQKKADIDGRHDLARVLGTPTGRARVRAIHHLAGGNHRVYVTMSEFLDRESLDDLVKPFMRMVDDLTPYYQDRMRQLAPQQRKLIEFLSRHETPAMVKEVARRCLISQQTAAKQLGELAKLGFVQSIKSGRATYYELSEPLMRICIEVKDNKTQHLGLFVRFLREWFTARELRARFRDICGADGLAHNRVDRIHIEIALKDYEARQDEPLLLALLAESACCAKVGDRMGQAEVAARLADELDNQDAHFLCVRSLRELGNMEEAVKRLKVALERHPQSHRLAAEHSDLLFASGRRSEALAEIDRAISIDPSYIPYRCQRGGILMSLERYEDVLKNEDTALRLDPRHVHSFEQKARALLRLNRAAEAESAARTLLVNRAYSSVARPLLSRALFMQGKYAEALAGTRRILRRNPTDVGSLCLQGSILDALGKFEAVLSNEDRLLAVDPQHYHSLYSKARALMSLGRFADAERASLDFLKHMPGDADGKFIVSLARAGEHGFKAGVECLATYFGKVEGTDRAPSGQDFDLPGVLSFMLIAEAVRQGPLNMAQQVALGRSVLHEHGLDESLADALMRLLHNTISTGLLRDKAWEGALPLLFETLSDHADCELPLKLLGVAVSYERRRDIADLLRLPLEQRKLLLEAFAKQPEVSTSTGSTADAQSRESA